VSRFVRNCRKIRAKWSGSYRQAKPKALIGISFTAISKVNGHAPDGPYSISTAKLETL
jgi:hypothetical protein